MNDLRTVWDPFKLYQAYSFERQAQVFPDVLLRKRKNGQDILLGIELKGWYLLAKEGVPSFRYKVSRDACHPWDLLVVVPWVLSNVMSGRPVVTAPHVESARYAAERRNYYWTHEQGTADGGDARVREAEGVTPYPRSKADEISDSAVNDRGGNFGRLARNRVMDEFMETSRRQTVCGIRVEDWLTFLRKHKGTVG